jgi:hypothetical protein
MKEIDDPVLGRIRFNRFCWEFERELPFLRTTLGFRIDPEQKGSDVSDKQRQVFLSILRMPAETRTRMEAPMFANYRHIRDIAEDDTMPAIATAADIWPHVDPRLVWIPRHGTSKHSYFFVELECAWEPEHGLEVLFKDGDIDHASQQDGLATNEAWRLRYINE